MSDDRTAEFLALARSLPGSSSAPSNGIGGSGAAATATSYGGRYGSNANNNSNNNIIRSTPAMQQQQQSNPAYSELRTFHKTAADISRDIAATSAMLSELSQLVRKKSFFMDDSDRINALVLRIKSNIENLNVRLDDAGAVIAHQKRRLGRSSQAGQEADNLVGQLKEEFVQATAGFKKVLQQRTDSMKETTGRKLDVYGVQRGTEAGAAETVSLVRLENKPPVYETTTLTTTAVGGMGHAFPTLDLTSGMSTGESSSSASQLPRPRGVLAPPSSDGYNSPGMRLRKNGMDAIPTFSGSASSYHGGTSSTPLTPWDIQRMEQESGQEQMMQLIPDQDYLRERADAMSTVESNIVELGTIFNKLAVMVSEHREMVQRVEDNVEDVNANINLSLNALTDTLTSLRTNRALALKIFSILVIFIIFFIVFFA